MARASAQRKTNQTSIPTRYSARLRAAKAAQISLQEQGKKEKKLKEKDLIVKKKRSLRRRQNKNCRLLALPGEIRNMIYRLSVIVEEDHRTVFIEEKCPGEPSLLRVCRQIRREARSIYFRGNEFWFNISDYNGAPLVPFAKQLFLQGSGPLQIALYGPLNWVNLLHWMKAIHDMKLPVLVPTEETLDEEWMIESMEDFAHEGMEVLTATMVKSIFEILLEVFWLPWPRAEKILTAAQKIAADAHICCM